MKKAIFIIATSLMISSNTFAEEIHQDIHQEIKTQKIVKNIPSHLEAVAPDKSVILKKIDEKTLCPKCRMTLPLSYKTDHIAHINAKSKEYCSINCLAKTIIDGGKVTSIKVIDNSTMKFIDVIKAWYVVGSTKADTQSMSSKYAFGKKYDAQKFVKKFGGKIMTFSAVLASVKSTEEKETEMSK